MMRERYLPQDRHSLQLAKVLRKNCTREEKHLWYDCLKKMPVQFYRQYVIEKYIVDFFCPKANLVIELDGSQHFEEEAMLYDAERTKVLESYGLLVLRYTNHDIHTKFDDICKDIYRQIVIRTESLP